MGIGLSNAYGLEAAQQGLRQRVADQLAQRKQEQDMAIQLREQALREQEAQQRAEAFKQSTADRAAALAERTQSANVGEATKLAPTLPMDQNVAPQAAGILRAGGMGGQLYAPPTMAETETGKPFDSSTANPSVNLGTAGQQKEVADEEAIRAMANDPAFADNKPMQGYLRVLPSLDRAHPGASAAVAKLLEPPQGAITDANYMLNGKPIVAIRKGGRLNYQGQDVTDRVTPYTPPVQPTVINIPGVGPYSVDRGGATGKPITGPDGKAITPISPQTERMQKLAEFAGQDVDEAGKQIDAAETAGLLGPGAGRVYGQFLAGIVGSTGNPEADRQLGSLKQAIQNVKLSYPRAASGGGGGQGAGQQMQRLDSTLNSDKFSAELLRGALDEMRGKMHRMTGAPGGSDTSETPEQRKARLRKAAGL